MSAAQPPHNDTRSQLDGSNASSHAPYVFQATPERPWLIRAPYYLRSTDLKRLTLPGAERALPSSPTYFSRPFLSKWLGGSMQPAFTQVLTVPQDNRVHLVAGYYVGVPLWTPQYPTRQGENGALLVVGKGTNRPEVPWITSNGFFPVGHNLMHQPYNCFIKRASSEYEYIGRYAFHPDFRKLTQRDIDRHVPQATRDLWLSGLDNNRWGKEKTKGLNETRKAEELFLLPDNDPGKLYFYWQYLEYIGFDNDLYNALCAKGEEIGWTTRRPSVQGGPATPEEMKGGQADTDESASPMSSDDEEVNPESPNRKIKIESPDPKVKTEPEEQKAKMEAEDVEEKPMKESPPEKKPRF